MLVPPYCSHCHFLPEAAATCRASKIALHRQGKSAQQQQSAPRSAQPRAVLVLPKIIVRTARRQDDMHGAVKRKLSPSSAAPVQHCTKHLRVAAHGGRSAILIPVAGYPASSGRLFLCLHLSSSLRFRPATFFFVGRYQSPVLCKLGQTKTKTEDKSERRYVHGTTRASGTVTRTVSKIPLIVDVTSPATG